MIRCLPCTNFTRSGSGEAELPADRSISQLRFTAATVLEDGALHGACFTRVQTLTRSPEIFPCTPPRVGKLSSLETRLVSRFLVHNETTSWPRDQSESSAVVKLRPFQVWTRGMYRDRQIDLAKGIRPAPPWKDRIYS